MTTECYANNRRIVILDDNVNLRKDFRKILSPPIESGGLDHTRAALFGSYGTEVTGRPTYAQSPNGFRSTVQAE